MRILEKRNKKFCDSGWTVCILQNTKNIFLDPWPAVRIFEKKIEDNL